MSTLFDQVLDAVATQTAARNLTWQGRPVPILVRKTGTFWPRIDTAPSLLIDAMDGPPPSRFCDGDAWEIPFAVRIQGINNSGIDLSRLSGESTYLTWQESLGVFFSNPINLGLGCIRKTDLDNKPPVDQELVKAGYDVAALGLVFFALVNR